MSKLRQIKQKVRECIANGLNKPPEIAEQLGYKPSYIRQVIGIMVRENELERVTVNGKSMIGFGLGQRLHDPFNLCKVATDMTREGRTVRKTPNTMPYKHFQYGESNDQNVGTP